MSAKGLMVAAKGPWFPNGQPCCFVCDQVQKGVTGQRFVRNYIRRKNKRSVMVHLSCEGIIDLVMLECLPDGLTIDGENDGPIPARKT